jgi:nucleotide-binding universal stress UspA family protein
MFPQKYSLLNPVLFVTFNLKSVKEGNYMKILLTTDGSENSDRAAKFLPNLDLSSDDEITVLHVISDVPFKDDVASYYSSLKQIKQEIASKIIGSTVNILKAVNAKISTLVIDGYPDKGIIDVAEDLNIDMIVIGAKGLKGFKALLIGSVTRSVAINSLKPVLIIKPPQWEISDNLKILFATDGSDYAKEAGRFLTLIPFSDDAEVTILHVIQSGLDIPERFHIEIDERIKEVASRIKSVAFKESEKIIEQSRKFLGDRFRKINGLTKDGDPTSEIINTAKMLKADIIAVGSKGMRGIKGMLGSVSRYILSHSECSVLIGKTGK